MGGVVTEEKQISKLPHQVIYRSVGGAPEDGILSCGFMHKPTGQKSQIDFKIPYYSCFVLLQGSGEYWDETGFRAALGPGSVVQRLPGRLHSTYVQGDGAWLEFYVSFGRSFFDALASVGLLGASLPVASFPEFETLLPDFEGLLRQMTTASDASLNQCLFLAQQTAITLAHPPLQEEGGAGPLIRQACALLEKDLDQSLSPGQVARKLCMGEENFRKLFQREMGISPAAYRRQKRMTAARMMLMAGQPVNLIARAVGYSDAYAFSKQFKHSCGLSPKAYVQSLKQAKQP